MADWDRKSKGKKLPKRAPKRESFDTSSLDIPRLASLLGDSVLIAQAVAFIGEERTEHDEVAGAHVHHHYAVGRDDTDYADAYFGIGHADNIGSNRDEREDRASVYYAPPGKVEHKLYAPGADIRTHGSIWGHDVVGNHYKGRYEPDTGTLSVVAPDHVYGQPPRPQLKRIISHFNSHPDFKGTKVKDVHVFSNETTPMRSEDVDERDELEHEKFWHHPKSGHVVNGHGVDHHAEMVNNSPEAFGLTRADVDKELKRRGDDETLVNLVPSGWVRGNADSEHWSLKADKYEDALHTVKVLHGKYGHPSTITIHSPGRFVIANDPIKVRKVIGAAKHYVGHESLAERNINDVPRYVKPTQYAGHHRKAALKAPGAGNQSFRTAVGASGHHFSSSAGNKGWYTRPRAGVSAEDAAIETGGHLVDQGFDHVAHHGHHGNPRPYARPSVHYNFYEKGNVGIAIHHLHNAKPHPRLGFAGYEYDAGKHSLRESFDDVSEHYNSYANAAMQFWREHRKAPSRTFHNMQPGDVVYSDVSGKEGVHTIVRADGNQIIAKPHLRFSMGEPVELRRYHYGPTGEKLPTEYKEMTPAMKEIARRHLGIQLHEGDEYFHIGHPSTYGAGPNAHLWVYHQGQVDTRRVSDVDDKHGDYWDQESLPAWGRADHNTKKVSIAWHPDVFHQERRKDAIRKRVDRAFPGYRQIESDDPLNYAGDSLFDESDTSSNFEWFDELTEHELDEGIKNPHGIKYAVTPAYDAPSHAYNSHFVVGGHHYEFEAGHGHGWPRGTPHTEWHVQFINHTNLGHHGGVGITGTGHAHKVFSHVADSLNKFIDDEKPAKIKFSAKEPSRVRVYNRMIPHLTSKGYKLVSKPEGKFTKGRVYKFHRVTESDTLSEARREELEVPSSNNGGYRSPGRVTIHWNPTKQELFHIAKTHYGHVRGIGFGKDYGFWGSGEAIHHQVAQALGMDKPGGEDWYKTRTEIVPHHELNNPEKYKPGIHDSHGPYVIHSPDYGEGLQHPHIQSLKLSPVPHNEEQAKITGRHAAYESQDAADTLSEGSNDGYEVEGIPVITNPSKAQLGMFAHRQSTSYLRLLVDKDKRQVHFFPAETEIHDRMADHMGIENYEKGFAAKGAEGVTVDRNPETYEPIVAKLLRPYTKSIHRKKNESLYEGGEMNAQVTIQDVQDFVDLRIIDGDQPDVALRAAEDKFQLTDIQMSPVGVVMSPSLPDPPPTPMQMQSMQQMQMLQQGAQQLAQPPEPVKKKANK